MSATAVAPTAHATRRKGVRNRLILLVATVMGLAMVAMVVAVYGLMSARRNATELTTTFVEQSAANTSYQAWLNDDDASNMFIALAQLKDPSQAKLMADTWAVVEDNRKLAVSALAPLTGPDATAEQKAAADKIVADLGVYDAFTTKVKSLADAGDLTLGDDGLGLED